MPKTKLKIEVENTKPEWKKILQALSYVIKDGYNKSYKTTGISITMLKNYYKEYGVVANKLIEKHKGITEDITEVEWNDAILGVSTDIGNASVASLLYAAKVKAIEQLSTALGKETDTYKLSQAVKILTDATKDLKEEKEESEEESYIKKLIETYRVHAKKGKNEVRTKRN